MSHQPVSLDKKADKPTNTRPSSTRNMPVQCSMVSLRLSQNMDSRPVKMTTEPRSIWKLDAYVSVRPTYMADVAVQSH